MIQQLSATEYHARPEISKHGLDLISRAPALFLHQKTSPPEQSPAMRWGEIVHTRFLEPDRFKEQYVTAPEDLKRTAKKAWAEFEGENIGKGIITFEESLLLESTIQSLMENQIVRGILVGITEGGGIEKSVFWESGDVSCRARPDGFSVDMKFCMDLKTCASASPDGFSKDAYNYRYHVQAAFYMDGLKANGIDVQNFLFVCIEKSAPHLVSVFSADEEFIELGRVTYRNDLKRYRECLIRNEYPGYSQEIQTLSLPKYAK